MNSGDTVFVLISAALVMLMTPGLALFYGGMVRGKNVLGTLMHELHYSGYHNPGMGALGLFHVVWT